MKKTLFDMGFKKATETTKRPKVSVSVIEVDSNNSAISDPPSVDIVEINEKAVAASQSANKLTKPKDNVVVNENVSSKTSDNSVISEPARPSVEINKKESEINESS